MKLLTIILIKLVTLTPGLLANLNKNTHTVQMKLFVAKRGQEKTCSGLGALLELYFLTEVHNIYISDKTVQLIVETAQSKAR